MTRIIKAICYFACLILIQVGLSLAAQDRAIPITPQPNGNLCWNYDEAQLPEESTFEDFINGVGAGSGIYTGYELLQSVSTRPTIADTRLPRIGLGVYSAAPDTQVILRLQLYSPEKKPQFIRYLILVNEHQIPIQLDGKESPLLDVKLEMNRLATFDIPLPTLSMGIQDIVIVGIKDFSTPPESTGRRGTASGRLTLFVGEDPEANSPLKYQRLEPSSTESSEAQSLTLTLGDTLLQWSYPDPAYKLSVQQPLNFNILSGYSGILEMGSQLPPPTVSHFALALFLDYKQIPLLPDADVLYAEVDQSTAYARIPVIVAPFETEGQHEIMAIRINHPQIPLCILDGPIDGYIFNHDVTYNRAMIDIINQ